MERLSQEHGPEMDQNIRLLPESVVPSWAGVLMDELKDKLMLTPEFCKAVTLNHLSDAAGKPPPKNVTTEFIKGDFSHAVNYQVTYKNMRLKVTKTLTAKSDYVEEVAISSGKHLKTRFSYSGEFSYRKQNTDHKDSYETIDSIRGFTSQI